LSSNGQRLAAQLYSPGSPPISVVYEDAQEVERFPGFGLPNWIDDDTLVLVGSKLVTARIGGEPTVINDEVTGFNIGNVAVSPDGSRLFFPWRYGLWIMNVVGSGLRELLPANRYIFPAWSPDGAWIAAIQQQGPTVGDAQLVGSGLVAADFEFTNLRYITLVNVATGKQTYADLTMIFNESQMPQGGLSWY